MEEDPHGVDSLDHLEKDINMPKVGKKTYPYTAAGKAAAKKAAKKTGKPMVNSKSKSKKGY